MKIHMIFAALFAMWTGASFADENIIAAERTQFEQAVRTAFEEQSPEKLEALMWPRDRPKPETSYDVGGRLRHLLSARSIRQVRVDKATTPSRREYMRSFYRDGIEFGLTSEPEYDVTIVAHERKSNKPYISKYPGIVKEGRLWVLVPVSRGRAKDAPRGVAREPLDVSGTGRKEAQGSR